LIEKGQKFQLSYAVKNTHRSVGTRLSSIITTQFKNKKLSEDHILIKLRGSAGQSLGAFGVSGIKIRGNR
jgi:glutamate synthase (NADPH/NADH) large chain